MGLNIDNNKCIGCAVCNSILEAVFAMDDEQGFAIVKDPQAATAEQIQEVIEACPVEAISW